MVTKLVTVTPQTDVFDGIRLLLQHHITGAPVVDEEHNYLGVLSEKCCMSVLALTAREASKGEARHLPAREFMAKRLLTLRPETDAFEAVEQLLKHRFSGAPVVDGEGEFLGVFSERYIMRLLIHSAYDQVPSTQVGAFMNTDRGRLIDETTELHRVARIFLDTYYRRLPVLRENKLVGQVSRRDVLRAEHQSSRALRARGRTLLENSGEVRRDGGLGDSSDEDLPSTRVSSFMDTTAQTIEEGNDLLSIAQIFLTSNRRRLPVLRGGKLVGQISRRDLLATVLDLVAQEPRREGALLYLSAVMEPNQAPAF